MLEKQEITCLVIDKINENEYQIYQQMAQQKKAILSQIINKEFSTPADYQNYLNHIKELIVKIDNQNEMLKKSGTEMGAKGIRKTMKEQLKGIQIKLMQFTEKVLNKFLEQIQKTEKIEIQLNSEQKQLKEALKQINNNKASEQINKNKKYQNSSRNFGTQCDFIGITHQQSSFLHEQKLIQGNYRKLKQQYDTDKMIYSQKLNESDRKIKSLQEQLKIQSSSSSKPLVRRHLKIDKNVCSYNYFGIKKLKKLSIIPKCFEISLNYLQNQEIQKKLKIKEERIQIDNFQKLNEMSKKNLQIVLNVIKINIFEKQNQVEVIEEMKKEIANLNNQIMQQKLAKYKENQNEQQGDIDQGYHIIEAIKNNIKTIKDQQEQTKNKNSLKYLTQLDQQIQKVENILIQQDDLLEQYSLSNFNNKQILSQLNEITLENHHLKNQINLKQSSPIIEKNDNLIQINIEQQLLSLLHQDIIIKSRLSEIYYTKHISLISFYPQFVYSSSIQLIQKDSLNHNYFNQLQTYLFQSDNFASQLAFSEFWIQYLTESGHIILIVQFQLSQAEINIIKLISYFQEKSGINFSLLVFIVDANELSKQQISEYQNKNLQIIEGINTKITIDENLNFYSIKFKDLKPYIDILETFISDEFEKEYALGFCDFIMQNIEEYIEGLDKMEIEKNEKQNYIILHPLYNIQNSLKIRQTRKSWLINQPRFLFSTEIEKEDNKNLFKIKINASDADHIESCKPKIVLYQVNGIILEVELVTSRQMIIENVYFNLPYQVQINSLIMKKQENECLIIFNFD